MAAHAPRLAIGPRRAWARDGYAHIEIGPFAAEDATAEVRLLEEAVESVDGVRWAAYNGALGQLVVRFDESRTALTPLVRAVDAVDTPATGRTRRWLRDVDPFIADRVALGADLVGAGMALVGRFARLPRVPAELAALPASIDLIPGLGKGLRRAFGPVGADLGSALASSVIAAASQTGLTCLADAALRAIRLSEASANREAWAMRARELHRDAESSRVRGLAVATRPAPLGEGPIERYARRIGLVALLAAGGLLVSPDGRRRAAQALVVGSPRAARIGRQAYAGRLGRLLAGRGVVVRDASALRRLDRIQTVVIDATVLFTGRIVIVDVVAVQGTAEEARSRAARLLADVSVRAGRPAPRVTRGGWALTAASQADSSVSQERKGTLGGDGSTRGETLSLSRGSQRVALVRVETELDPLGTALVAVARRVGRVLLAGASADVAKRVRADGRVAGGSRLADSVRELQGHGGGVALVAARNDVALAQADCGIGILTTGERRPPWGAHLLAGPGLESAWLVLEAASLAKGVSGRSARLAVLGSVAGALLALTDSGPRAGRRALTASAAAAMVSLMSGVWSARALARRSLPVPEGLVPWHALSIGEVLRLLEASPAGLSDEGALQRRGASDSPEEGIDQGILAATLSELDTPLTAPLAAGAGISAATGSTTDAILVLAVILGSALLSATQGMTARRAMRRLQTAADLRVRLHRNGEERVTSAAELVPGDVLSLDAGDAVPADCRLLTCNRLEVDESTLTGESLPVVKDAAATLAAAVADRTSMVYAGTTVVAGAATAIVVATGRATEAGRSAGMTVDDAPTGGVQARLRAMTQASVPVSAAAAATVLLGGLVRGRLAESVTSSVALAVAAIPEGLPFVATAAELSTSKRLTRHNILVRKPRALEAAGRVDVVCFDKTGTLTEGRIRVRAISNGRSHRDVGGAGPQYRRVIAAAMRASPAPNGDGTLAHPTDRAIIMGAADTGVEITDGAPGWRAIRELPFEPERGFHAVLGEMDSGYAISVKGAPEIVLPRCVTWTRNGRTRPLTEQDRREVHAEVDRLAQRGLRVLAIGERTVSQRRHLDDERVEQLNLCGLLGLADTTRPTAAEAVRRLRRAGVKVVMLTGDHPSTAAAIGAELDLLDGGGVVTGPELDDTDESAVDALVSKAAVFARVSPSHKVAVVRSLRRAGHVVAVTGDGANDAPAIRLADVGIALGDQGTDAARQAADMIVVDGRIETIADGIIAGRAMWASVRDAVALLLGGNLGEILFAVGSSAISPSPPLNARQILFVNLMTDLLPALAVASRAPRGVSLEALAREGPESSLGTALTHHVAQRAVATALGTTAGWLAARLTGTAGRASSVAVASLVASQLAQTAVAGRGDPAVLGAVGLSAAALVATVQTPGVSHFFGSRPLGPVGWGTVFGAAVVAVVVGAAPAGRLPGLTQAVERLLAAGPSHPTGNEGAEG
ncbi:MAG TPA: HAD-IC family P-type ATPase [Micromonosporaceae bacterium]